jgi:hypothetical protein
LTDGRPGARNNGKVAAIVVEEQPFWRMVEKLREFEGARSLWRVPVAGLLRAAVPLALIAATVLGAFIARDGFNAYTAILSAIIVLAGTKWLAPLLARRFPWRGVIADRLWTWEKPNPRTEVHVLVAAKDTSAARTALRRAGFNPQVFGVRVGVPPESAPDLDYRLGIHEPEAWPQSDSDHDRNRRILAALREAGIRAYVGGVPSLPIPTDPEPRGPGGVPVL